MALLVFVAAWIGAIPLRKTAVARCHRAGWFSNLIARAETDAQGAPLVVLLGTSQTRRSLDPRVIQEEVGDGVFVTNAGMDGTHPCAYPYLVRRLLDEHDVAALVVEIGWIGHDQYQGVRFVRRYIEDAPVRAAIESNPLGWRHVRPTRHGDLVPLSDVGRQWRNAFDAERRLPTLLADVASRAERRGFTPVRARQTPAEVIAEMNASFALQPADIEDAYLDAGLIEALRTVHAICRERGVPVVFHLPPVNRAVAPEVAILRHFETAARRDVIPALTGDGARVLVAPETFFAPENFSDHVHLHADAAPALSRWLGASLVGAW